MPLINIAKTAIRITLQKAGLLPYARRSQERIERDLFTRRQNRLRQDQIDSIYSALYHERAHYGTFTDSDSGWEPDAVIKLAHAKAITQVFPHIKKILIGGCSSGMGVLAFRRLELESWGFDISPDLDSIVLPEVKDYIRQGSMTNIPFEESDRFQCFVTTDVLEHVQLKDVKRMVAEMHRLNFPWMAHLINHTSMQPDHMTLKPLKWWAKQVHPYYRLRSDLQAQESGNPHIYGLNGDPLHVYTFWERTY